MRTCTVLAKMAVPEMVGVGLGFQWGIVASGAIITEAGVGVRSLNCT